MLSKTSNSCSHIMDMNLFCHQHASAPDISYHISSWLLQVRMLSQKWDCLPPVQYANVHTEQRYCLYCIFAQTWVLGDHSTKLTPHLAESQRLYTLTKTNQLFIAFDWFIPLPVYLRGIHPAYLTTACLQAGGCSLSGSELSQWLRSPPAAFTFSLVTFHLC